MAAVNMVGYYDSARHAPFDLTWYFASDINQSLTLRDWTTKSVYINDMRLPNGKPPTDGFDIVDRALVLLRGHARAAAEVLLMSPNGLDGRPHATGGGWIAPGCRVTFYVARCPTNSYKFLCANVYGANLY